MLGDSRKRVLWTSSGTYHKDCLKRCVKFPASVMVWGCMSARGVGNFTMVEGTINALKYQDILNSQLLPCIPDLQTAEGEYLFQQDGASCHTAKSTKEWFTSNDISVIPWPSSSPDLSPIESLWGNMKRELRRHPVRSINELKVKLQNIWQSTSPECCQKLVDTMPRRTAAVISRNGDATQW